MRGKPPTFLSEVKSIKRGTDLVFNYSKIITGKSNKVTSVT